MQFDQIDTPIGPLIVAADEQGLRHVIFAEDRWAPTDRSSWRHDRHWMASAVGQFRAWFAGEIRQFDLPLAATGSTFQQCVWRALCTIPYAGTCSYAEIATMLGSPSASRAVGAANGRNPLPIVVPCHRVIGADGSLTGFGGGLPAKRWLLAHEARVAGGGQFELRG